MGNDSEKLKPTEAIADDYETVADSAPAFYSEAFIALMEELRSAAITDEHFEPHPPTPETADEFLES